MKQDDHGGESSLSRINRQMVVVIGGVSAPHGPSLLRFPPGRGDRRIARQFPTRGETGAVDRDQRAEEGSRHKRGGSRPGAERATRTGQKDDPKRRCIAD